MRVTLIAGLPGSGKTSLALAMASEDPGGSHVLDDPDRICLLDAVPPRTRHLLVVHPAFCSPAARDRVEREVLARFPDAELAWIFFENEPRACLANAEARADGRRVAADVAAISRGYAIPDGADVRRVPGAGPRLPDPGP